jgi:hypothetical protein
MVTNHYIITNYELRIVWKYGTVTHPEVQCHRLYGGTEENIGIFLSA